jgi:alkanesulfonate monooxygenase SsuD/methylene tetrahydromethanopterin reductase-like flavin-dependent oxidoreductase (luciferase family)
VSRPQSGGEKGADVRFGLFGGPRARGENARAAAGQGYRTFIEYAVAAERLGFSSAFVVEHHFSGLGQLSSPLQLLGDLAARTSTIRLGTAVSVLPWHDPVLLAEQVATLDVLSAGRVDLGVGRGYRPNEFHGFAVDPAEAEARFDECLGLLLRSWTADEPFSHEGRFWRYRDVLVEPAPAQRPHPPVWTGAGSESSIKRAAASGFRLLLDQFADIGQTSERVSWYREAVEEAGRTFEPAHVAVTRALVILFDHEGPEVLEAEIDRRLAGIRQIRDHSRVPGDGPELTPADHAFFNDARGATASAVIGGSPAACIERLQQLEAAGVETVLLNDPLVRLDRLELFADRVMPVFT